MRELDAKLVDLFTARVAIYYESGNGFDKSMKNQLEILLRLASELLTAIYDQIAKARVK
ncbi:hypothetical protein NBRC116597_44400 [Phaeobacter sp. NW0010-22]